MGTFAYVIKPRKNNCWFPVTRPTLILTPDPTELFNFFQQKKKQEWEKNKNNNLLPKYHDGNGYFP
jgi:hypothetical protein